MVASLNGGGGPKPNGEFKFLIYGEASFFKDNLTRALTKDGIAFEYGKGHLEDRSSLEADIAVVKPTHVFNVTSVLVCPDVKWLETHKLEPKWANLVGTLTLADVYKEKDLILINCGTGCSVNYKAHSEGCGISYKEEDTIEAHFKVTDNKCITSTEEGTKLNMEMDPKQSETAPSDPPAQTSKKSKWIPAWMVRIGVAGCLQISTGCVLGECNA